MRLSVRVLGVAVVWLASCQTSLLLTKASQAFESDNLQDSKNASSIAPAVVVDFESNSLPVDSTGAAQVHDVFLKRFSQILANETQKATFLASIGVILASPEQLQSTFSHASPSAQLLKDPTGSGSPEALRAIAIARSLATSVGTTMTLSALDPSSVVASLNQLTEQLARLSPSSSHPITRRIVLASLVLLHIRLQDPGLPSAFQPLRTDATIRHLLFRIYRLLFEAHRRGAAVKGAVEFLHISKSGGTSMCSVADRNGCSAESTTNFGNCMVRRFDDRPRWVSAAVHNETQPLTGWRWYSRYLVRRGERSCEYRDEFMQRARFTFYSNEFAVHGGLDPAATPNLTNTGASTAALHGSSSSSPGSPFPPWSSAHLCPQFLNLVMLRHPLDRLLSHVRWIIKVYRTEYGRSFEPFFRSRDADYWRRFAPAAVDNYYTRLLLGEAVYYLPPEAIDATHMAAARLVLLQYDVVLLLEAPDIDALWLKQALGWRAGLSGAKARVAVQHRYLTDLLPWDMDDLMDANAEDVKVYEFGAALHQLDGLMFAAVAAAGIEPYDGFNDIPDASDGEGESNDKRLGRLVQCGYVTRRKELLAGRGYDMAALLRKYPEEFPRIPAADEQGGRARSGAGEAPEQERRPQQQQRQKRSGPQKNAGRRAQLAVGQRAKQVGHAKQARQAKHAKQARQAQAAKRVSSSSSRVSAGSEEG